MSTLALRIITAVVMAGGFLALLFLAPAAATAAFLSLALLIGFYEWAGFAGWSDGLMPWCYTVAAATAMAVLWQTGGWLQLLQPSLVLAGCVWSVALFLLLTAGRSLPSGLVAIAGWLLLLPAWLAAERLILAGGDGPLLVFMLFWMVAGADIGAYFTGKSLGKRKLLPKVSPGKTVEGLFGGLATCALAATVGMWLLDWTLLQAVVTGVAVALVSVVGDLTVSLFKRNAGLKDSGKILPGHGGLLDRIDGVIAALPLYVALLWAFGKLPGVIAV